MTTTTRFHNSLDRSNFQPLNGKTDPFDLLSTVGDNIGDAQTMMEQAGVLGWQPEMIPLSGMDSRGNIYELPQNAQGIVVPEFPGGPQYFGQAHMDYSFIRPEEVTPLIDVLVAHGNPLTGIMPGPITRFFFESNLVDLGRDKLKGSVGELIKFRWQLDLGNTGKSALVVSQRGVRLICSNGMTTNHIMGSVSISHSGLAPTRIEATVQKILAQGKIGLENWISDARKAINTKLTLAQAHRMWAELFKWSDDKEKGALTRQENQQAALTQLWGANTQTTTYPETAWAFFGATTEYLDHGANVRVRGGSSMPREEVLARRVVEGAASTETVKNRAWDMALNA